MVQGTTPTLTFTFPIDVSGATYMSLAFEQDEAMVLEKTMDELDVYEKVVSVTLTEAETLQFSAGKLLMQIRLNLEGTYMASKIVETFVTHAIKRSALQ